jgi:hypothetical protein
MARAQQSLYLIECVPTSIRASRKNNRYVARFSVSMPTPIDSKAPPLVVTTLAPVFARRFDRDALLREARRLGAVKRGRAP